MIMTFNKEKKKEEKTKRQGTYIKIRDEIIDVLVPHDPCLLICIMQRGDDIDTGGTFPYRRGCVSNGNIIGVPCLKPDGSRRKVEIIVFHLRIVITAGNCFVNFFCQYIGGDDMDPVTPVFIEVQYRVLFEIIDEPEGHQDRILT